MRGLTVTARRSRKYCMIDYDIKKKEPGKHLKHSHRLKFQAHLEQGMSVPEAGKAIGCSRATSYAEFRRGRVGPLLRGDWTEYYAYDADYAQRNYDTKATAKGPREKLGNHYEFAEFISGEIKQERSPYHALEAAKRTGRFKISICTKTLYNYIDKDYIPGISNKDLPMRGEVKRKYRKVQSRKVKPLQRSIEDRPEIVEAREEFGHWELDTVIGKAKGDKPVLAVFTERKTRAEIIRKIPDKTQESVIKEIGKIERYYGKNFSAIFKSITMDNGTELSNDKGIEKSVFKSVDKRTLTYYCHPYCSSERGSNENQNKHIRRKIPKGTPISGYEEEYVSHTESWLNSMYRKKLGGKSAAEAFLEELEKLGIRGKKRYILACLE